VAAIVSRIVWAMNGTILGRFDGRSGLNSNVADRFEMNCRGGSWRSLAVILWQNRYRRSDCPHQSRRYVGAQIAAGLCSLSDYRVVDIVSTVGLVTPGIARVID